MKKVVLLVLMLVGVSLFAKDKYLDMVYVEDAPICGNAKYNSNVFCAGKAFMVYPFYISKFEVTQTVYADAMTGNELGVNVSPFHFAGENLPAEGMTWYDAVYFCNRLSEKSGLAPVYAITDIEVKNGHIDKATVTADKKNNGYRLPTEKEQEFAARGGKKMNTYVYAGSDTVENVAWTNVNSEEKTHPVGKKSANALGLYDMSGNVWEYTETSYGSAIEGVDSPSFHIIKGGGWFNGVNYAMVSHNFIWVDNRGDGDLGIRVVRRVE